MKAEAFDNVHILIVGGKAGNVRELHGILLALGAGAVILAENTDRALDLLASRVFQAVFCDEAIGPLDVSAFIRAVRRSGAAGHPRAPILMTADALKRAQVERVRDAGVDDLIVRPLTAGEIKRKLLRVLSPAEAFAAAHRRNDAETWEV